MNALNLNVGRGVAVFGLGLLLTAGQAVAGPLEPTGPPASSSVTLNELDAGLKRLDKSTASLAPSTVPNGVAIPPDPGGIDPDEGTAATTVVVSFESPQGTPSIVGPVVTEGEEGSISVMSFSHSVTTPRDAASGLPTGRRQHKPMTILKRIDKASPQLFLACARGTHFPKVDIKMRKSAGGDPPTYYTITLEECIITSISTGFPNLEQVEMIYETITMTSEDGTTATDTWTDAGPAGK